MTLRQLEYFMAVAETLSFTRAADSVFVSQPTLSRGIQELETELGVELLMRNRHEVALTASGISLYTDLRRLSFELKYAIVRAQEKQSGISGELRIGVLDGQALPKAIQSAVRFIEESLSNIKLSLVSMDFAELKSALKTDRLDAIITFDFELTDDENIYDSIQLENLPAYMVLPEGHPLNGKGSLPLSAFSDETFVVIKNGEISPSGAALIDSCRRAGFEPRLRYESGISSQLLRIQAGGGISPFNCKNQACNIPGLGHVEVTDIPPSWAVLVWLKSSENPCVSTFAALVRTAL